MIRDAEFYESAIADIDKALAEGVKGQAREYMIGARKYAQRKLARIYFMKKIRGVLLHN